MQFWVENINRTAPNTSLRERWNGRLFSPGEEFEWGESRTRTRHVVPKINSMFKGKRPMRFIKGFRPMTHLMEHHSTGPARNRLDGTFSDTVLEVSADATELDELILQIDVGKELGRVERMVVNSILLDLYSI